ncbi:MAG: HNH endonuclease [Bdellovibrionales bacterium]|nr:HNH endonuclease [Massilia sp.]
MSTQSFTPEFREAIWLTYHRKCFYGTELITLEEMEIDHLLPESYLALPDQPAKLSQLGLPADFNICGYENLVPACRICNQRKNANELPIGQLGIFVSQIANNISELQKELAAAEKGNALGHILVRIANSIKKGRFTPEELKEALRGKGLLDFQSILAAPASPSNTSTPPPTLRVIFSAASAGKIFHKHGVMLDEIEKALMSGAFGAERVLLRDQDDTYVLRTNSGLVIVYKLNHDEILVKTAYRKQ